jgi:hypothetical protein
LIPAETLRKPAFRGATCLSDSVWSLKDFCEVSISQATLGYRWQPSLPEVELAIRPARLAVAVVDGRKNLGGGPPWNSLFGRVVADTAIWFGAVAAFFSVKIEMKTVVLFVLLAAACALYFGYEPYDLIPSWPKSNTPPPKVRRAPAAVEQTPATAPQRSGGNVVIAEATDGSLEHRWKPYPTPSPTKP